MTDVPPYDFDVMLSSREQNRHPAALLGNPVVFARPGTPKAFKTDAGMAVTLRVKAMFDATDVQLTFANWHLSDDLNTPNAITVKASIADPNNVIYPVTFANVDVNGYVTIQPGTNVTCLPVGVTVRAGENWKLRWNVIPAIAGSYPVAADNSGIGFTNTVDQVTLNTAVDYTTTQSQPAPSTSGGEFIYAPVAVTARPSKTNAARYFPTVMIVGDSTANGFGDNPGVARGTLGLDGGMIQRALQAAGIGFLNFAIGGYLAQKMALNMRARLHKMEFASSVTDVIVLFGTNDLYSGRTAVQIQTDLQTIYDDFAARGIRVWAVTVTPRTNTSGVWTAGGVASQQSAVSAPFGPETPAPSEWKKLNDWIKTAPVPLAGVFDTNSVLSTFNAANQTYVWADGLSLDGVHYNAAGAVAGAALINTAQILALP